jgi:hypothetical protein
VSYLDSDIKTVMHVVDLELQIEFLKSTVLNLQSVVRSKDIKIGNLNSEKKKIEALKNQIVSELNELKNNSVNKVLFTENIDSLKNILKLQRKFSENEEERKVFENFISILNKINAND